MGSGESGKESLKRWEDIRDPVEHPGCANHSTGSTLLKPIRALAGINGIVAHRSLSSQFTGQTGCPATSKGTFISATILYRTKRSGASESRVLPTRWSPPRHTRPFLRSCFRLFSTSRFHQRHYLPQTEQSRLSCN